MSYNKYLYLKISYSNKVKMIQNCLQKFIYLIFVSEEPFPDWLEEKIDLPIFDDLPPPPSLLNNLDIVGLKPSSPLVNPGLDMAALKPSQMNSCALNTVTQKIQPPLINNGIEVVGMKPPAHSLLSLNPLQYHIPPPPPPLPLEQTPVQLIQEFDYSLNAHDTLTPPESPHSTELVFTMLQEMQPHELDELVRMRVESLVEAPATSVTSPRSSIPEEIESIASPSSDSGYSDPEWTHQSSSDLKAPKRRRVTKPYSRTPPEEKRMRKKEQNKNAATRYRLKKKQEIEDILGEEKELQQKNEHLKSELTELGREIKYLKNLMRDMFKAKGLIK